MKILAGRIFLYCALILLAIFTCFPVLWMVLTSLKPSQEIFSYPPDFIPKHVVMSHFIELFTKTFFPIFFKNSFIIAISTTFFCIIAGSLGAYSLTRFRYRGREIIANLTLLTYMFAPIMIIIPLSVLLTKFRLSNSHLGLVLACMTFGLPLSLWLMRSFFLTIPLEIEEASWMDGANRVQSIFYVIIPLALPGIIATSILVFIMAWNDYIFARVLISYHELLTFPVGVDDFAKSVAVNWGVLLSAGTLATAPAVIMFIAVQRYLIAGWGSGGIK